MPDGFTKFAKTFASVAALSIVLALPLVSPPHQALTSAGQTIVASPRHQLFLNITMQLWNQLNTALQYQLSLAKTIETIRKPAKERMLPYFRKARITYPPSAVTLVCFKEEKVLIVFARNGSGKMKQIIVYPIVGTSGSAGPKLKEGDLQIPEGFYKITGLQPNSVAHLALRVDYPNKFDRANAIKDRRKNLGGDIEIHGHWFSTGCLAMGDPIIEELFLLSHDTGCENINFIVAPCDLTWQKPDVEFDKQPSWLPDLYMQLKTTLKRYPFERGSKWVADVPLPEIPKAAQEWLERLRDNQGTENNNNNNN